MTLGESLRQAANEDPAREAYVYGNRRLSYGDWDALSERMAANLLESGARKGDRVAIVLPPRPEYPIAYLAAAKAGLVTVGVNPRLAAPEIAYVLADCAPRIVVTISSFGGRDYATPIGLLHKELGRPALFEVGGASGEPFFVFEALFHEPTNESMRRLAAVEVGEADPVAIVYTTGTTGQPKGALFALRSLEAVCRTRGDMGTPPGARSLTGGTPFAHVGFMTKILGAIEDRQTTAILDQFKARTVLETVEAERITHLGGVPAQWALLLLDPELERFDLSSLRGGAIGGAPFTPELVRDIRRRFEIDVVTRYSATEIAMGTGSRPGDAEELVAETVGRAASEVEIAIVDGERRRLGTGEVGEVAVRSPAVMEGYWRRPVETAAVLDRDGWFYTGDLGELDDRGYLRLRGRAKEMYIRGGYNVYPVEVEACLARHPAIAEVAVVGVPDPVLGEKGLAVVVCRKGAAAPTLGDLRTFCRTQLADYKAPDFVQVVAALPLNATFKVDKRSLRNSFEPMATPD